MSSNRLTKICKNNKPYSKRLSERPTKINRWYAENNNGNRLKRAVLIAWRRNISTHMLDIGLSEVKLKEK